ncbi:MULTISPECIES: endonuclease III [Eubacterium]|uniref:Endonuclease III n=1 Tax=Eubacterium barkeri TaxID=1528 RepID=A0A1H3D6X2_EUBBA|nr:endonuclease III [Eubacterium barkeri]SDX62060.1 DNA-(apurinic or apyrimidinic site) lyase /endonuclease III [Eubacterium barkeri]
MNKETRMKVIEVLGEVYGDQVCGLDYQTPFELLIATMLSAQCTDVRVNLVTAELFKEYNTPEALLTLNEGQLKEKIKTCGLANTKAKNILLTCHLLLAEHGGIVPCTMEALTALPGVGRKTANVVMSNAFDIPAIAVDTHVFRVSRRIGLAKGNNVLQVEHSLMKNIPKAYWSRAHHWIIWHGRKVCTARNPKCESCVLNPYCDTYKRENKELKK